MIFSSSYLPDIFRGREGGVVANKPRPHSGLSAAASSARLHARWSTFEAPFDPADEASVTAAVRRECK